MGGLAPPAIFSRHYHLFRAMQFHMSEKSFDDVCQLEADINKLFKAASTKKDWIHSLPNKWRTVVDNNGDYIIN